MIIEAYKAFRVADDTLYPAFAKPYGRHNKKKINLPRLGWGPFAAFKTKKAAHAFRVYFDTWGKNLQVYKVKGRTTRRRLLRSAIQMHATSGDNKTYSPFERWEDTVLLESFQIVEGPL